MPRFNQQTQQDFEFDLGSQYGTVYTQDYSSPQFYTQEEPLPEDSASVYQTETYRPSYAEAAVATIFGPSVVHAPSEERLFGELPDETPPQPSRQYESPFSQVQQEIEEEDDLGRGKRLKIRKDPYTPSTR